MTHTDGNGTSEVGTGVDDEAGEEASPLSPRLLPAPPPLFCFLSSSSPTPLRPGPRRPLLASASEVVGLLHTEIIPDSSSRGGSSAMSRSMYQS